MIFDAVNFSKSKWFDQQRPPFGPENIRQATFVSTRGVRRTLKIGIFNQF